MREAQPTRDPRWRGGRGRRGWREHARGPSPPATICASTTQSRVHATARPCNQCACARPEGGCNPPGGAARGGGGAAARGGGAPWAMQAGCLRRRVPASLPVLACVSSLAAFSIISSSAFSDSRPLPLRPAPLLPPSADEPAEASPLPAAALALEGSRPPTKCANMSACFIRYARRFLVASAPPAFTAAFSSSRSFLSFSERSCARTHSSGFEAASDVSTRVGRAERSRVATHRARRGLAPHARMHLFPLAACEVVLRRRLGRCSCWSGVGCGCAVCGRGVAVLAAGR